MGNAYLICEMEFGMSAATPGIRNIKNNDGRIVGKRRDASCGLYLPIAQSARDMCVYKLGIQHNTTLYERYSFQYKFKSRFCREMAWVEHKRVINRLKRKKASQPHAANTTKLECIVRTGARAVN